MTGGWAAKELTKGLKVLVLGRAARSGGLSFVEHVPITEMKFRG
jgi:hypothetical protein